MTPLARAAAPILQAAQLAAENGPALLAIDGRCGSGKSTLAQFLAGQLGCRVVHTDDFYLPLAARCANWQEQPGANMDFIRLRNEVLQPLLRGETALYNAYSCAAGAFLPSKPFAAAPLTILEGSYSLHPALQTDFAVGGRQRPPCQRGLSPLGDWGIPTGYALQPVPGQPPANCKGAGCRPPSPLSSATHSRYLAIATPLSFAS